MTAILLSSCKSYNALQKTTDYDYKYEAAKQAYAAGHYTRAYQLLDELILIMKGTANAEECLFMDAMCYYNIHDYETATLHFDRYFKTYPKGTYTELARFYSGKSSFLQSPDPRLDQTPTYTAINSLQDFLEFYPLSERRAEVNDMIFQLQDRLVQKEYESAQLYYNLGSYVVRARYHLANNSVRGKANERFTQTIDEYWGFKNEFPDSKYIGEADRIFRHANSKLSKRPIINNDEE